LPNLKRKTTVETTITMKSSISKTKFPEFKIKLNPNSNDDP